jgi:hypothetical protein
MKTYLSKTEVLEKRLLKWKVIYFLFLITCFIFLLGNYGFAQDLTKFIGEDESIQQNTNDILYDQTFDVGGWAICSQNFESDLDPLDVQCGDDFIVNSPGWVINSILVLGRYFSDTAGPAKSVNVWIYSFNNFIPDSIILYRIVIPTDGLDDGNFVIPIYPAVNLQPGHYFLSVQANLSYSDGQWGIFEHKTANVNYESVLRNPGGGWVTLCDSWGRRFTDCNLYGEWNYFDFAFSIYGYEKVLEPTNHVTNFTAVLGIPPYSNIYLTWTDATGDTEPDGYLIKRSSVDFSSITNPIDGVDITPNDSIKKVIQEIQLAVFTGLASTTYYFKIFPYKNSGSNISYKTDGVVPQINITTGDLVSVESTSTIKTFDLEQNFPNPFNPQTTINFKLPVEAKINLKVFNILGQEVANLLNGNFIAGSHHVDFNASSLISGVYIYKIEATGIDGTKFIDVKKMILTK